MNDAGALLKQITPEFSNSNNIAQVPVVEKSMYDSAIFLVPAGLSVDGMLVGEPANLGKFLSIADQSLLCVPAGGKARSPGKSFDDLFKRAYAVPRIRGPNGQLSDGLEIICQGEDWRLNLSGSLFMVLKWSDINKLIDSGTKIPSSPYFNTIQTHLRARVVTHDQLQNEILRKFQEIHVTASDVRSPYQLGHHFSSCNRVVGVNGDNNHYNRVMISLKFLFELLRTLGFEIEISCFDRTKCNILLLRGPGGEEINKYIWVGYAATTTISSRVTFAWGIDGTGGTSVGPPGLTDVVFWVCAPTKAASGGGAMDKTPAEIRSIANIDEFLQEEGIGFLAMNMSGNAVNATHNVFNVVIDRRWAKPDEISLFKQKDQRTNYSLDSPLSEDEASFFGLSYAQLGDELAQHQINGGLGRTTNETCQNLIAFGRYGMEWKPKHWGQIQYSFGTSIGQNHATQIEIKKVDLQPQGPTTEESQRSSQEQMIRRGFMSTCMDENGLLARLPNIATGEEERLISIDRNPGKRNIGEAVFNRMPFYNNMPNH